MKLLTRVFTTSTETDDSVGFCSPQYALVSLSSPEVSEKLLKFRELAEAVSEPKPPCGSKRFGFDHLVVDLNNCFAVFFNDYTHSVVGPYLESKITTKKKKGRKRRYEDAPPLAGGLNYCLVPDDFVEHDPDEETVGAIRGGDGPVHRYISFYLMVATEGFWFTNSVKGFSAKLMTAVIPWHVLEQNHNDKEITR